MPLLSSSCFTSMKRLPQIMILFIKSQEEPMMHGSVKAFCECGMWNERELSLFSECVASVTTETAKNGTLKWNSLDEGHRTSHHGSLQDQHPIMMCILLPRYIVRQQSTSINIYSAARRRKLDSSRRQWVRGVSRRSIANNACTHQLEDVEQTS